MSCEETRPLLVVKELPNTMVTVLEQIANTMLNTGQPYEYELDCEIVINDDCTYEYFLLRGSEMYALILVETPGTF